MKRIIATALALALCCGLLATAAFAEGENGGAAPASSVEEQTAGERETAASSGEAAAQEPGGETGEADEDAGEPDTPDVPEPDAVGTMSFANLETRIRENNITIQALNESIASVDAIDFDKMEDNLRDALNGIAELQFQLITMPKDSLDAVLNSNVTYNSLQSSYDSLKDTFDDLRDGKLQRTYAGVVRQLENAEDQLVNGAETLYVTVLELQNTRENLQRTLAATNRTVQELELRYTMGQISALQLQQAKAGRTTLTSGIATLEMNIENCIAQLQQMAGADITGTMTLSEVPEVTAEQLDAMDLEKDLETAKEKSYTLYDAKLTLDDAKDTYDDACDTYSVNNYNRKSAEHTWKAAQYTYQAAVQAYELKFRTAFAAVADYRQILAARETALALQQDTCRSVEMKYQQGAVSKNTYLSAQDDLASAENDVVTAKHDLFTAYRAYRWAMDSGLLN